LQPDKPNRIVHLRNFLQTLKIFPTCIDKMADHDVYSPALATQILTIAAYPHLFACAMMVVGRRFALAMA
jgi:hypothetical protein